MAHKHLTWGMVPLLLLAVWLGLHSLNARPLWYDEWYSLYYAGAAPQHGPVPLATVWERVARDADPQPPGYYLLLSLWGRLVGWTPFAARVLSLLLGVLASAWVYRLATAVGGVVAGLGAAAAFGTSSLLLYHLSEARPYTLYPLMVAICLWGYWRILSARGGRGAAAAFTLGLAGMIYTHYMAVTVIGALGLYHVIFARKDRRWLGVVGLGTVAGFAFLPWVVPAAAALLQVSGDPSRAFFARDPLTLLHDALYAFSSGSLALLALFAVYAVYRGQGTRFAWVIAVGTAGLTLAVNAIVEFITNPRYVMGLWPSLALLVGLGAARMSTVRLRPWLPLGLMVAAGVAVSLFPAPRDPRVWPVSLDWMPLASALTAWGAPSDTTIYLLPAPAPAWIHAPVAQYRLFGLPAVVDPMPPWVEMPLPPGQSQRLHLIESLEGKPPAEFGAEADRLLANLPRVWLAHSPTELPSPFALPSLYEALGRGFVRCEPLLATPVLQLALYARTGQPVAAHFGADISAHLLRTPPSEATDALPIALGWTVSAETPAAVYSVALHVEDASGTLVAQADAPLPPSGESCRVYSLPLTGLPEGEYRLLLLVYRWETGERLTGRPAGSDATVDRVPLAEFAVTLDVR